MISFRSLNDVSRDKVLNCFSEAFADYEVVLSKQQIDAMLMRRGFVPELSFGAFDNEKLVSFTLNSKGEYNKLITAYDTGTGTIIDFRGKGLAGEIFKYSIPFLKKAGIQQYLLEVLQNNKKAISIYQKSGFMVSREFNYYVTPRRNINIGFKLKAPEIRISEIGFDKCNTAKDYCDFLPSWQNSLDSVRRSLNTFKFFGAFEGNNLLGFAIFQPLTGDISQIAVSKSYRRLGVGSLLLRELLSCISADNIKIINADTECDSLIGFLKAHKIEVIGKQFEMSLKI